MYGYNSNNVYFHFQTNAFMTLTIFMHWAEAIFFIEVEERRAKHGYDGPVVLILDKLGSHHSEDFLDECAERNIIVVFNVAHI